MLFIPVMQVYFTQKTHGQEKLKVYFTWSEIPVLWDEMASEEFDVTLVVWNWHSYIAQSVTLLEILLAHLWSKLSSGEAIENQSTQRSPDANICQHCCPNWKQTIWCRPTYIYVYRAGASATIHNNYVYRTNRRLQALSSPSSSFACKKKAQWAFGNIRINIFRQAWAFGQMDRTQTGS